MAAERHNNDAYVPNRHCRGICPAAATFLAPLLVLWLISWWGLWLLMPPDWFDTRTLPILDPSEIGFESFARDIAGRMYFSIMSTAVWISGIFAVVLAYYVVCRNMSNRAARNATAIGIAVGIAVACLLSSWSKPDCPKPSAAPSSAALPSTVPVTKRTGFRVVVVDYVMCVAERDRPSKLQALDTTQNMILANTFFGFAGAGAVMAAFGALAMRFGDWSQVTNLRRRLDDFRTLTLMASVLFVLNALVTKALVSWAQAMLETDIAPKFGRLADALLNYWAAQSSVVLVVTIGCAAIFIQWDVGAAATAATDSSKEQVPVGGAVPSEAKWKETNELVFDSTTVVTATIGTIAPLLAGPAVDLVTKALQ